MSAKFTPGQWHIGDGFRVIGANSQRVAVCDENHATPGLANAVLIAAAPDLLIALENLADACSRHGLETGWECRQARVAIAKAMGAV